jgi:hypothetical protein
MSGLTDQDARALTHLARRLRTETHGCKDWDEAGTWAVVKALIGQNLALTIERVTRHAIDPEAKTPGAIKRPFLPPAASEVEPKRGNPKRGEDCKRHPGQWPDICAGCRVDRAAAPTDPPADTLPPLEQVNPNLAARIKARLQPEEADA